jgi:N-acetylmuramoyl-L-alanine amidase
MPRKRYKPRSSFRIPLLSRWRDDLRFWWYTSRKGPWVLGCCVGIAAAGLGLVMYSIVSSETQRRDLTCLALNVYHEARGEPAAGRYAVAEVTMNRVASPYYPKTVCDVVYQKEWDYLRRRYVSAFSWTEFDSMPHPDGEPWQEAWNAAEDVYFGRRAPTLRGALHYHATYIKPSWARTKRPVARIGRHIFYR